MFPSHAVAFESLSQQENVLHFIDEQMHVAQGLCTGIHA